MMFDLLMGFLGGGRVWDVQMRKPRKKRRVMGWELRRQCRSPCFGCWAWLFIVGMGREGLGGDAVFHGGSV